MGGLGGSAVLGDVVFFSYVTKYKTFLYDLDR